MTTAEKITAGIYGYSDEHLRTLQAYETWKLNYVEMYARKYTSNQPVGRKPIQIGNPRKFLTVP